MSHALGCPVLHAASLSAVLCDTADISAVSHSRYICCGLQEKHCGGGEGAGSIGKTLEGGGSFQKNTADLQCQTQPPPPSVFEWG